MTTHEVLVQARALIADPDKWTQRYFARNALGAGCDASDKLACKWCSQGAVCKVSPDGLYNWPVVDALDAAAEHLGWEEDEENGESPSANLNDNATHADVLAMFDCAIAASA